MRYVTTFARRLGRLLLVALALASVGQPALASKPVTFAAGSLIIPMDTTYQDAGMIQAYGLLDRLLRAGVPVSWCIVDNKVSTNAAMGQFTSDFTASSRDFQNNAMVINNFAYRGGPFVIDSANAAAATPIIQAFQGTWPNTKVHVATAAFNATESVKLTASPSMAVLRDGGETIAYGYLNAADIRDSANAAWSNASPGAILTTAAAGASNTNHQDGVLFRPSGQAAFCEMMAMHYNPDASAPEVAQEVISYMQYPTHFNAECRAIGTVETSGVAHLLSTNGIVDPSTVAFPNLSNLAYTSSALPYAQQDGPLTVEGGVIYAIQLALNSKYYDNDIVMIKQAGQQPGNSDVWMTGYAFGACPVTGCQGQVPRGQVTFLGGHQYDNSEPMSTHPSTQGLRLWLNSLFDTPCTNAEGQPVVTLTKTAPPSVTNGTITYTIAYKNTGFGAALGFVLSDKLPNGATFVSATGGGVNNAGTVTWNIGDLAPGASGQVTVTVTLGAPGTYSNTATGTYQVGNNTFTVTSNTAKTVFGAMQPVLSLTASAPATTTSPNVTLSLTYTNGGAGTAQGVVVSDPLPPGTTFVSASNGGVFAGGVVTWNVGNVPANGTGTLTVDVVLQAYGTYLNTGVATYGDGANSFSTNSNTTTTVYGGSDAQIVLTASAPAVTAIAPIQFQIAYQNTGTSTATNVVVTDVLPPGVTFVSASNGGANNAGIVTWNLGNVAGGASGTLTINVTLNAFGLYKNQGTATYVGNGAQTASSNTTTTIYGPAQPNVQLTASAPTLTYTPQVTFTINWANLGGAVAGGLTITDKLPVGATFVSATNGGVNNAGTITWNLGNQASFTSGSVSVTVSLGMPGVYLNGANAAYTTPGNVAQTASSNITSTTYKGGLTLVAAAPATTVVPQVAFTLTYTNVSGSPITNLIVTDTLPNGAQFVSASNGGTFMNGTVTWNVGNVAANGTATLTVNLVLPAPGTFMNTGTATYTLAATPFTATSNTTSTVYQGPNVVVTTMGPATTPDGLVTYTISYVNNGPGTAQALSLTDILPNGAMFVSATGGGVNNNGTVTWNIGDVPANGMGMVTVTIRLPQPGTYMNAGSATFTVGTGTQTVMSTPVTTVYQAPTITLMASAPAMTYSPQVTFTINYSNTGQGTATNVVITDALPNGATFVSATGGGSVMNGTVTWNVGTVAPGGSGMVTVTVTLAAPGTYMNQGKASYAAGAQSLMATSNTTTTVYAAGLSLTTGGPPTTLVPQVSWTVTYTNVSGSALTNLIITDALPNGAMFVSATGGGTFANGTVTWNVGNVPVNGTATFTVTLVLPAPGTFTNTANATFSIANSPAMVTSNTTTTVYQGPNVQVTMSGPGTTPDGLVTYTINYVNNGPGTAVGLSLKDVLPMGATFVSATGGGVNNAGTVTWAIGDVPANGMGSVTVTIRLPQPGTYMNSGSATFTVGNGTQTVTSNPVTTVYQAPSITLTASAPASTYSPQVTFTINYSNAGPGTATNVVLSDALPMGATFVSATNGGTFMNGAVSWNIGTLASGAMGSVSVTLNLPGYGTYSNTGQAAFAAGAQMGTATSNTTMTQYLPPYVTLTASAPANTVVPQVTYTINYSNPGPLPANNFVLTDVLQMGATFVSATNGGVFAGGTVTWNLGNLAVNAMGSVSVTVNLPAPGTYSNQGRATYTANAMPQQVMSNTTSTVYQAPGLQVTITCPPTTNSPTVTCTVSYTNSGNAPAIGVKLSDVLPMGAQYVSSTGGGMFAGGAVSWTIGDVQPGAMGMVTFTFTFPNAGTFTNQVTSSYTQNGNQVNGNSNVATTVYNAASVILTASAPATTPVPQVTFTIAYQNAGQGTALGFKIADTLPMGVTFVSASNGGVFANGVVTWNLSDLAGGAMGQVTVTVNLPSPGTYMNRATGTFTVGLMGQTVMSNVTTTVYPPAGVTLTASAPAVTAVPNVTFTINYTNSGMGTAQGLTIADALPPGTTFVAASNGGVFANGTVTWNIGDLPNGASGMVTVQVTLNALGTYMNSATGAYTTGTPQTVTSNTTTTLYTKAGVTLVASAPAVTYVPTVTFTIDYANNGMSQADSLVVSDPLPMGATFMSATNGGMFANGVVTWNVGNVAVGGKGTLQVTLVLPAYGTYTNQASGAFSIANAPQMAQSNTTSTDYLPPGIQVTVSGPGTVIDPSVTWTVSFVNNGKDPASQFVLTDKLPPGATFVSASNGGTFDPMTGLVTWNLGSLPPGAGGSVTVTVKLPAPGTYPDSAGATFTQNNVPLTATSNTVNTLYPPAGLVLVADGPSLTATPQVTYKITYTNTGMATAQQAVITNLLPPGTTFVGASTGGMFANGVLTWNVGDVPAGASGTVSFTVTLPKPGTYQESAKADFMAGMPMTSTSNTVSTIYRTPPLQIVASAPPTTLQPSATFTLTYTNAGLDPIANLVLFDLLLPGETFVSATGGGVSQNGLVTWNLGTLPPGATASVSVSVALSAPGTYVNQGTATYTALNAPLGAQSNVTSTEYLKPGLMVTVAGPPQTTTPQVTYTVTATNTGNAPAQGVVLTDPLPPGTTFVAASNGGTFANGAVTWSIGDVPPGATYSVTFVVTLAAPGNYTDTAKGDYTVANTPFTADGNKVTTIYPVPGVAVTASAPDIVYAPSLTITLAYENKGQAVAQGAVLTAPIPAGAAFMSATKNGAYSAGVVTWNLGDLMPGDKGLVDFTVTLPGVGAYEGQGLATFTAGQQPFAVPSNVTRTVYVIPTLQLVASAPAMTQSPMITLQVDWQNTGTVVDSNVVVSDKLPPNVMFVSASNGGVAQSGVVSWNLGSINPGDKGTLTIDVVLGAAGTYTNSFGGAFTVANIGYESISNVTTTIYVPVAMDGGVDAGPADAGPADMAGNCINGVVKCGGDKPICDQMTGLCRGCKVDAECPAMTPFCDVQAALCRGCRTDSDCGGATSGIVCDDTTKVCRPGCRGSGGNGCPTGNDCSSKDTTIGTCGPAAPDGGVPGLAGGGFGCEVSPQSGGRGAAFALLGVALAALLVRRRRR